jgi:hypothetical protein
MSDGRLSPPPLLLDSRDRDLAGIRAIGDRCQRAMRRRVPELAGLVFTTLRDSEPAYRSGAVPPDEPPLWIGRSIARVLDAVPLPPGDLPVTLDVAELTGARRGRQGVPPRALLRAYHIGGRALSTAFMQWASAEDLSAESSALLISRLWEVVDAHSAAAVTALCRAQDECVDHHSAGYLLDALLNGDTRPTTIAIVARALALPEQGRYAVIARQPAPRGGPPQGEDLLPYVRGMRVIWRRHGESALGVVALGAEQPTSLRGCLPGLRLYRTGISAALAGLGSLGRARQQAESAARTLRGPGLAFLEDRLEIAILNASPDLARQLQAQVLGPVLALEARRQEVLLDTLEAWLAADGSVVGAAAALYCHRNTVLNRLRRIEELTGRSLSVPRDLIDLGLALEAVRRFDGAR